MAKIKNVTTIRIGYDNFIVPTDKLQTVVAALGLLQRVEREYVANEQVLVKVANPEYHFDITTRDVYESKAEYDAAMATAEE